jgi:hypothetical protein
MKTKELTVTDIKYICRHMMGVDWIPSFIDIPPHLNEGKWLKNWQHSQSAILDILSTCQSKLEVMYFLGIGYWLNKNLTNASPDGLYSDYPSFYADYPGMAYTPSNNRDGQKGIHISEPWHGYSCGNGPSAILVIPQWKSPDKDIHHDFGIFTASDNGGGPPWYFHAAIEIEGYAVHKQRRAADASRYTNLSYIVTSVREELTHSTDWFRALEEYGPDSYENNIVAGVDFICPIEKLPSKEMPQCTNCGKPYRPTSRERGCVCDDQLCQSCWDDLGMTHSSTCIACQDKFGGREKYEELMRRDRFEHGGK